VQQLSLLGSQAAPLGMHAPPELEPLPDDELPLLLPDEEPPEEEFVPPQRPSLAGSSPHVPPFVHTPPQHSGPVPAAPHSAPSGRQQTATVAWRGKVHIVPAHLPVQPPLASQD